MAYETIKVEIDEAKEVLSRWKDIERGCGV